uniref:Uncharacterized protein n=1 Tax=virus sp. ct5rm7 TaxID=2827298 RepID=A0A8S5RFP7_9VIRU|nr:MAG TPA: hypothetical protein [virus sp. ct5rm7]
MNIEIYIGNETIIQSQRNLPDSRKREDEPS